MNTTAQEVLANTQAKIEVPPKVVESFTELVEKLDADSKGKADDDSDNSDESGTGGEPETVATGQVEAAGDEAAQQVQETAPENGVVESATDDTRAPQLVADTATPKPKAPRKPLIDWTAVAAFFIFIWKMLKHGVSRIGNAVGSFIVAAIVLTVYFLRELIPGLLYFIGWMMRNCYNAFIHGWKHDPLFTEGKLTAAVEAAMPGPAAS